MPTRHRSRRSRLSVLCLLVLAGAVAGTVILRQAAPASRDDPAPAVTSATGVAAADVGRPAPSQVVPQRPEALGLPSGTSMLVDVVSTGEDGVLELPADIDRAGWWDGGSRIGEPYGAMVLAAHVDSVADGIGPFAELLRTRPGQRIRVSGTDGAAQLFEIASVRRTPRTSLSERASTFSVRGPLRLVLITCAGPFDPQRGGYRDNLVVVAKPVGRPLNGPARGH